MSVWSGADLKVAAVPSRTMSRGRVRWIAALLVMLVLGILVTMLMSGRTKRAPPPKSRESRGEALVRSDEPCRRDCPCVRKPPKVEPPSPKMTHQNPIHRQRTLLIPHANPTVHASRARRPDRAAAHLVATRSNSPVAPS